MASQTGDGNTPVGGGQVAQLLVVGLTSETPWLNAYNFACAAANALASDAFCAWRRSENFALPSMARPTIPKMPMATRAKMINACPRSLFVDFINNFSFRTVYSVKGA